MRNEQRKKKEVELPSVDGTTTKRETSEDDGTQGRVEKGAQGFLFKNPGGPPSSQAKHAGKGKLVYPSLLSTANYRGLSKPFSPESSKCA